MIPETLALLKKKGRKGKVPKVLVIRKICFVSCFITSHLSIFEKCHDLNNNLFELESFSLLKNENATLGDDGQSNTFEIS